jgi:tetratricopeptide (TPR) repeat protein
MGVVDNHENPVSTDARTAVLWRDFCLRFQRQRSGADSALRNVLTADPHFGIARATAAIMGGSLGHPDFDAHHEIEAAQDGAAENAWERSYIEAASAAADSGPLWGSVDRWFAHHDGCPTDLNGLLLAIIGAVTSVDASRLQELHFRVERTHAEVGDEPMVLGALGMGAQERGELDAAEQFAARALELDPTGSDGAHPMAHVYFERGDHHAGAAWLDEWLSTTDQEADFTTHLYWHAALHRLALGDIDQVLSTYVNRLCGAGPRSLSDRTSMLWRPQLHGLVGPASDPSEMAIDDELAARADFIPSAFAASQVALGFAACGDVDSLRRLAETAALSEAPGATTLVQPISIALADRIDGDDVSASDRLLAIEHDLLLIGGSHAQREVLEDTLIETLIRAGRIEDASFRLRARLERRPSALDEAWLTP